MNIEYHMSNLLNVMCGVPQGSILRPLVYLIYVNDIHKSCSTNILLFAYDTMHAILFFSNIKQLLSDSNGHISDLFKWFCANKLSLNASKTKCIIITQTDKKQFVTNKYTHQQYSSYKNWQ